MNLLVLAVVSCFSVVTVSSVNMTPVIATYTPACQTILKKLNTTVDCTWDDILEDYELTVRLGFCTENEYSNLTATQCGGDSPTYTISEAKKNFYAALNNVSSSCQQRGYDCIFTSVLAVVSKQQEQFCSLMNLNISGNTSATCLTTGQYSCTQNELLQLQTAACMSNTPAVDQIFSKALLNTSATCQSTISHCADTSTEAWYYILSERYCESLKIGGNYSASENCFKGNNQCTAEEVGNVQRAACDSQKLDLTSVIATYSGACRTVLNYSKSINVDKKIACSKSSVLAGYEFLVRLGFCTENEYSNLTATVCGWNPTSKNSSEASGNFYAALNKVSSRCQQRGYDCIFTSVVAVASRQQEQFCSLMNLNINGKTSEMCLTNGQYNCTPDEFNVLKRAACSVNKTSENQTFSTALLNTTATCQSKISGCADTSSDAWIMVLSERYCDSLMIGGNFIAAEACFKENYQCSAAEVDSLKFAACNQLTVPPTTTPTNTVTQTKAWSLNLALLSILTALLN